MTDSPQPDSHRTIRLARWVLPLFAMWISANAKADPDGAGAPVGSLLPRVEERICMVNGQAMLLPTEAFARAQAKDAAAAWCLARHWLEDAGESEIDATRVLAEAEFWLQAVVASSEQDAAPGTWCGQCRSDAALRLAELHPDARGDWRRKAMAWSPDRIDFPIEALADTVGTERLAILRKIDPLADRAGIVPKGVLHELALASAGLHPDGIVQKGWKRDEKAAWAREQRAFEIQEAQERLRIRPEVVTPSDLHAGLMIAGLGGRERIQEGWARLDANLDAVNDLAGLQAQIAFVLRWDRSLDRDDRVAQLRCAALQYGDVETALEGAGDYLRLDRPDQATANFRAVWNAGSPVQITPAQKERARVGWARAAARWKKKVGMPLSEKDQPPPRGSAETPK